MAQSTSQDFLLSLQDLSQMVGKPTEVVFKELEKSFGKLKYKSLVEPQHVRRFLSSHGFHFPKQTFSFQMLKGGVAKTTSALNFGIRASMMGCRVLFVDLDQQANLTFALGEDAEDKSVWVDIVEKKTQIKDAIISIAPNVDLIPSNLNNSVLDRVLLTGSRNWSLAVKNPLKEVESHYDLIIIDTAPNLSAINTAVTVASDRVVLPINPDKFSILGLRKHLADLEDLKKEFDLSFQSQILFTKFDGRESASKDFLSQCIEEFPDQLMKSYVRTSSEIKNTIRSTKTVFSSKNSAKEDYDLVTCELLGFNTAH